MNELYAKIGESLSGGDIMRALYGKCKIVTYPEIHKYKSIDQLLGKNKCVVILYLKNANYGHWTCLFRQGNKLEFFDPYGEFPDGELDYMPDYFNQRNNQNHTYLLDLMDKSPYDLEYNDHQLQKFDDGISTCGRHVICRLIFRDVPINDYFKIMQSTEYSPDEIVTVMTENI